MPYKDIEKRKETSRLSMEKMRKGLTTEGLTSQGLTQYHPILDDLIDPIQREKLEAVCLALKRRNLRLFYGIGKNGLPMDIVGELLDATNRRGNETNI